MVIVREEESFDYIFAVYYNGKHRNKRTGTEKEKGNIAEKPVCLRLLLSRKKS